MQADVRARARSREAKLCRIRPQRTGVGGSDKMAADSVAADANNKHSTW